MLLDERCDLLQQPGGSCGLLRKTLGKTTLIEACPGGVVSERTLQVPNGQILDVTTSCCTKASQEIYVLVAHDTFLEVLVFGDPSRDCLHLSSRPKDFFVEFGKEEDELSFVDSLSSNTHNESTEIKDEEALLLSERWKCLAALQIPRRFEDLLATSAKHTSMQCWGQCLVILLLVNSFPENQGSREVLLWTSGSQQMSWSFLDQFFWRGSSTTHALANFCVFDRDGEIHFFETEPVFKVTHSASTSLVEPLKILKEEDGFYVLCSHSLMYCGVSEDSKVVCAVSPQSTGLDDVALSSSKLMVATQTWIMVYIKVFCCFSKQSFHRAVTQISLLSPFFVETSPLKVMIGSECWNTEFFWVLRQSSHWCSLDFFS